MRASRIPSCFVFLFALTALPAMSGSCSAVAPATYDQLVALGATGCALNDLLFSNFSFAGSATGTGTAPVASQMSFTLDNPTITGGGQTIWGFEFNPNLGVVGVGTEDIQIQYDITAPFTEIASIHLLETASATAAATGLAVEGPDCGKTTSGGGCTFLPTMSVTLASPHQDLLGIGPYLSLHVITGITVVSSSKTDSASITDVRNAVDETGSTVPEPATFSYMAGSVLLVIAWRRLSAQRRSVRN
jgi:hypothetical protein